MQPQSLEQLYFICVSSVTRSSSVCEVKLPFHPLREQRCQELSLPLALFSPSLPFFLFPLADPQHDIRGEELDDRLPAPHRHPLAHDEEVKGRVTTHHDDIEMPGRKPRMLWIPQGFVIKKGER